MSLVEQLQAHLAGMTPAGAAPSLVVLQAGSQTLRCELAAIDSLAAAVVLVSLRSDALSTATVDDLRQKTDLLCRRLTYLLEPVNLIEIDADRCALQMRSNPPHQGEDSTSYYELVVERGGQVSLSRFRKQPGQPRERITAQLTREVLLRLVGDLSHVAG